MFFTGRGHIDPPPGWIGLNNRAWNFADDHRVAVAICTNNAMGSGGGGGGCRVAQ